jgi:hypothetical protein
MSGDDLATLLDELGVHGHVVSLRLREGEVRVVVRLDEAERACRQRLGIGPVVDRALVNALWLLPDRDTPGPAVAPPAWTIERLRQRLPAAIEQTEPGGWVRTIRPPATVLAAVAQGHRLRALIERVGQLSALAPMVVEVDRDVSADDPALLDAGLYGVGVATVVRGQREVRVRPAPVVPTIGVFSWWVAELAYAELVTGNGVTLAQFRT